MCFDRTPVTLVADAACICWYHLQLCWYRLASQPDACYKQPQERLAGNWLLTYCIVPIVIWYWNSCGVFITTGVWFKTSSCQTDSLILALSISLCCSSDCFLSSSSLWSLSRNCFVFKCFRFCLANKPLCFCVKHLGAKWCICHMWIDWYTVVFGFFNDFLFTIKFAELCKVLYLTSTFAESWNKSTHSRWDALYNWYFLHNLL